MLLHLSPTTDSLLSTTSEMWQRLAQVLESHLQAQPGAQVMEGPGPGTFHVIYPLAQTPLVSIIIPTKDLLPFLSRCMKDSLLSQTDYPAFEILLVDNDTAQARGARVSQDLSTLRR